MSTDETVPTVVESDASIVAGESSSTTLASAASETASSATSAVSSPSSGRGGRGGKRKRAKKGGRSSSGGGSGSRSSSAPFVYERPSVGRLISHVPSSMESQSTTVPSTASSSSSSSTASGKAESSSAGAKETSTSAAGIADESKQTDDTDEKTSADYYFDSYAHFGIHEEMLKDHVRTDTYRRSIVENPHLFQDKIVLDIGAGTGILSMFAAQAGAKHVYAIECAGIAVHAKKIVAENGFDDRITIIHGKVEEIELPVPKVDIIISEWMGYFLIYESMLDTVLYARDKWLDKENGVMMPDKGRMFVTCIEDRDYKAEKIEFWDDVYGFKMTSLKQEAIKEPLVDLCPPKAICSDSCMILNIDLYKVTAEELDFSSSFKLNVKRDDYVHALVVYFDVFFSKTHTRTALNTSPRTEPTHWKQTIFYLDEPLTVTKGSQIIGQMSAKRNRKNPRDLDIMLETHYSSRITRPVTQVRLYAMR